MKATIIADHHVSKLIDAARMSRYPARDVALVRFLAETGARPIELARLTWRAFCDAEGKFTGRASWQTAKRGGRRDVAMSAATVEALMDLKARVAGRDPLDGHVFRTERNGPFAAQSMRAHLKTIAKRAGLHASGYSLRHLSFDAEAKAVVAAGGTGAALLGFTGHKSLSSVQHYLDAHDATRQATDAARASRCASY